MEAFVINLNRRIDELGLNSAELARRTGMSARSVGHYTAGRNEPNLTALSRLAQALNTRPDILLGFEAWPATPSEKRLRDRVCAALIVMDEIDQKVLAASADATVKARRT